MANEILLNQWQCTECKNSFCISGIERLQHLKSKFFSLILIKLYNVI